MRRTTTAIGLMLVIQAGAQITIGPTDMPSAGDTMRYRSTDAGNVDLALTGENVVWDFSMLTLGAAGADTAVAVSSTPFAYQFFFNNNFLYPDHSANFALKGVESGLQGVSFEDVYDYYKRNADGYRNVGFGANLNGIPTSIRRVPVDFIHRFPVNYGDMDTSFSSFNVAVPTLGFYEQDQWRYNTVDGWGELILPGNTFEVLRVRSVLQQRDSLYIDQFGFGFATNRPQTVEYRWIAQGMDAPVLIVTTVAGFATTARFQYDPQITTGTADLEAEGRGAVWPNPADALLHIQLPHDQEGVVVLYDAHGREVYRTGRNDAGVQFVLSLADLAPGAYCAQLLGMPSPWSKRFVIQR